MGATTTYNTTPRTEIDRELGIDGVNRRALVRATGTTFDGATDHWVIVEQLTDDPRSGMVQGEQVVFCVMVWRGRTAEGTPWVTTKVIDEDMGPTHDVPERIWAKLPPLTERRSEYSRNWRASVESERKAWPLFVKDVQAGQHILVQGWDPIVFEATGGRYRGAPVFWSVAYGRSTLRGWKKLRCRIAEEVAL